MGRKLPSKPSSSYKTSICKTVTLNNTAEPVYYGHLGTGKKYPDYQGVLIFQVVLYKKYNLGPHLSVWIMQVSIFSSVHISRFHCKCYSSLLINISVSVALFLLINISVSVALFLLPRTMKFPLTNFFHHFCFLPCKFL